MKAGTKLGSVAGGAQLKGHCQAIWQLYKKLEGVSTSTEFP